MTPEIDRTPPDRATPDYIEPVIGWRVWYAVDDGEGMCLTSVVHRTLWLPGAPLEATCRRLRIPFWPFAGRGRHDAPASDCSCGIYAVQVPALRLYVPEPLAWHDLVPVVGRVYLWGEVHEHSGGWRASRAYPESLFVPVVRVGATRTQRVLGDLRRYGVPVTTVEATTADGVIEEVCAVAAREAA